MNLSELEQQIEAAWDARDEITAQTTGAPREAVTHALALLDSGKARVYTCDAVSGYGQPGRYC